MQVFTALKIIEINLEMNSKCINCFNIDFIIPFGPQFLPLQDVLALLLPVHFLPPFFACLTILLLLYLSPRPQALLQESHCPQEDHWQFTEI